jgi:hypothetical protein
MAYSETIPSGYAYFKTHQISGSTDGAMDGYQVKLVVHRWSGMDNGQDVYLNGRSQSWPDDIRFVDSDGHVLNYWIEAFDSNVATIWINVFSIPESPGSATISLYYGRAGDAGVSSGASTFPFFEDWSSYTTGCNINGQGGWTVNRIGGTGSATIRSDGGANVLLISSSTPDNSVIVRSFPLRNNQAYLYRARKLSGLDNLQFEASDGTFMSNGAMANGYDVVYGGYGQAYTMIRRYENGSEHDIARIPDNTGDTSYHTYEWTWSGDNFSALRDGIELAGGRDSTWPSRSALSLSIYQANAYCSYVLVRNFTENEPAHGLWGMENQISPAPALTKPSDYGYEKACTVMGSPDGDLDDYQLKFIVHRGDGVDGGENVYLNWHSLSWPYDIRFTDIEDDPFSYWVESYDPDTATVWVKMDRIPASPGSAGVVLHYGNANDASVSDGDSTFLAFDDFTGGSLDTGKWNFSGNGSYTINNGNIRLSTFDHNMVELYYKSGIPASRYVIEASGNVVSPYYGYKYRPGVLFMQGDSPDSAALGFDSWAFDDNGWCVFDYPLWSWRKTVGPANIFPSDPYNGSFRLKVTVDNGSYSCQEALRNRVINGHSSLTGMHFGLITQKCTDDYDWVLVRQYTPNEPVPVDWGSEVSLTSAGNGPSIHSGIGLSTIDIMIIGGIAVMLILIVLLIVILGVFIYMASKHK